MDCLYKDVIMGCGRLQATTYLTIFWHVHKRKFINQNMIGRFFAHIQKRTRDFSSIAVSYSIMTSLLSSHTEPWKLHGWQWIHVIFHSDVLVALFLSGGRLQLHRPSSPHVHKPLCRSHPVLLSPSLTSVYLMALEPLSWCFIMMADTRAHWHTKCVQPESSQPPTFLFDTHLILRHPALTHHPLYFTWHPNASL